MGGKPKSVGGKKAPRVPKPKKPVPKADGEQVEVIGDRGGGDSKETSPKRDSGASVVDGSRYLNLNISRIGWIEYKRHHNKRYPRRRRWVKRDGKWVKTKAIYIKGASITEERYEQIRQRRIKKGIRKIRIVNRV